MLHGAQLAIEEANARGDGSIAFGGQLIDRPIIERASAVSNSAEPSVRMGSSGGMWVRRRRPYHGCRARSTPSSARA